MRIEKKTLNDALRVLGKVVCQTSSVELYRSVRFVGDGDGIRAMATDGVEMVSVAVDAFTDAEINFCVPFKIKTNSIPNKEENKMGNIQPVGSAPVQMVAPVSINHPETELNPLEDLGNSIEDFKLKLKVAFDDLAMLSRKVKEVQIQQRQKECDFIQPSGQSNASAWQFNQQKT